MRKDTIKSWICLAMLLYICMVIAGCEETQTKSAAISDKPAKIQTAKQKTTKGLSDIDIEKLKRSPNWTKIEKLIGLAFENRGTDKGKKNIQQLADLKSEDVDNIIIAMLKDAQPSKILTLIRVIGSRKIVAAKQAVIDETRRGTVGVKIAGWNTLAGLADETDVPQMVDILSATKTPDRANAVNTLLHIIKTAKDKKSIAALIAKTCDDPKTSFHGRSSMLWLLGKLGQDNTLKTLYNGLKEGQSSRLRESTIRGLSFWPNSKPAKNLLALATDYKETVRNKVMAIRVYIKLVSLNDKSAKETIKNYRSVMSLIDGLTELIPQIYNEQNEVLKNLVKTKDILAMEMASEYLNKEKLADQASETMVALAEIAAVQNAKETVALLKKIADSSCDEQIKLAAEEKIKKM